MSEAKFLLSKKVLKEQIEKLKSLGLKISYSYKTNREVGDILQTMPETSDIEFSIHAKEEIDMINDKNKIWFFLQAESIEEIKALFEKGINKFVVDNEIDLKILLDALNFSDKKIWLGLRMKFQEHRVGTGKYFVYGMPSKKINELLFELKNNEKIEKLGIHIHRKSQNVSEWEIKSELENSILPENFNSIHFINLGGGLPSIYKSNTEKVFKYIFGKIEEAKKFLEEKGIETYIEPGRFIAAPAVKLETEIIQIQGKNIIINTTIYNCALDTLIGNNKMLVEGELSDDEEGIYYLIKGNSPTRDDIFRYKVKLKPKKLRDKIVFLNAGAYNYTTDFFGYKKLKTEVLEDFSL